MKPAWWRYLVLAAAIALSIAAWSVLDHGSVREIVVWSVFALAWLVVLALRNRSKRTPAKP